MNCFLRFIGVVDTQDSLHHVQFEQGLNIITGASSTGKSAILEIFDFCLGASEDTIPVGIITQRTKTFLIALEFSGFILVAARTAQDKQCYLTEWHGETHEALLQKIMQSPNFFIDKRRSYPLDDYKKELGRHFAVTFKNVDLEPWRQLQGRRKSPTPSIRSFASFMLQHQNLVANKHAIFYRFDEKEKRDQAIEHFKILMGLVNEDYFDQYKKLELAESELKKIQTQIPREQKRKDDVIANYSRLLSLFQTLAGQPLVEATAAEIHTKPEEYLQLISQRSVQIDVLSNQVEIKRRELQTQIPPILLEKRKAERQLVMVESSIKFAADYSSNVHDSAFPKATELSHAHCPLCETPTDTPAIEAARLIEAINWLNGELKLSAYTLESFADQGREISKHISELNDSLVKIQEAIRPLDEEINRLATSKSINEQALMAKLQLELAIRDQLNRPTKMLSEHEKVLLNEVSELKRLIKAHDVERKIEALNASINEIMCKLGDRFDFEPTYRPSKLRFDVQTFELWYEMKANTRVYLRSMGSGANWLYSHLALFLSLHYQFAAYSKDKCKIPPILFLDQPTQVYFPALDEDDSFNSRAASKRARRTEKGDADLNSVKNMFTQLAKFCDETKKATGVMPQIIVSDHADKLQLGEGYKFSDYVRAIWRERGFIAEK